MKVPTQPNLAPPAPGLPAIELFFVRILFAIPADDVIPCLKGSMPSQMHSPVIRKFTNIHNWGKNKRFTSR